MPSQPGKSSGGDATPANPPLEPTAEKRGGSAASRPDQEGIPCVYFCSTVAGVA